MDWCVEVCWAVGMSVNYPPGQFGDLGEVLPVDDVANAADGLGEQHGRGRDIGQTPDPRQVGPVRLTHEWKHGPPHGQEPFRIADHDIQRAADEPADDGPVDRDASRVDLEDADEVVLVDFIPKIDDVKEPGADHSADDGPYRHGVDGIDDHPLFSAPAGHQIDRNCNRHESHHAMPGKSERPEMEQVGVYPDGDAGQYAH